MEATELLEDYRLKNKLSRAKLAKMIGLNPSGMSRIMSGETKISLDLSTRIKSVLGLEIEPTTNKLTKPNIDQTEIMTKIEINAEALSFFQSQIDELKNDKKSLREDKERLNKIIDQLMENNKILIATLDNLGLQSKDQRTA